MKPLFRTVTGWFCFMLLISPLVDAGKPQDPFLADAVKKYGGKEAAGKAIVALGWKQLNEGFWEMAVKRFHQAGELTPENPDVLWGLGAASAFQQKWDEAITQFQKGLKLDPGHANLLADLGWAYEEKGMLDEAAAWNEKAREAFAKMNPPDPHRWKPAYNSGLIHAKKGRYEEAITALNEATQINSDLGDAYGLLAIIYYERGQYDLAVQNADKAVGLGFRMDEEFLEALKSSR